MKLVIDIADKKQYKEIEISEIGLSTIIHNDWKTFFPDYDILAKEFSLKGQVRSSNKSGRIDFIAYNQKKKCLTIFELKKDYDKNIRSQIFDYEDFIQENFSEIYLQLTNLQKIEDFKSLKSKKIELVLIAKTFKETDIRRLDKMENIVLIQYSSFEKFKYTFDIFESNNKVIEIEKKPYLHMVTEMTNNNKDIFKILTEYINNEILVNGIDYKIKGSELLLRVPQFYEKYSKLMLEQKVVFPEYIKFRDSINKSIYCKGIVKSVKFKLNVYQVSKFSIYELNLLI
jgi:hypothetical protein